MQTQRLILQKLIEKEVFVTHNRERIVHPDGTEIPWTFDFRRVVLQAKTLDAIGELFWDTFKTDFPFQIGGVESAAIPLITGFVLKLNEKDKATHGFFVRKSRKKDRLMRMIEGTMTDEPIILVDDILNTGTSFIRQVEILEKLGKKIKAVFVILRFRDLAYYQYFHDKGIAVKSLFCLDDFKDSLGVKNVVDQKSTPIVNPFTVKWYFQSEKSNHYYVIPKSAPALDASRVYFGSDSGIFWALNQTDGSVAWKYKVGFNSQGKSIFSSSVLHQGLVYFGSYDGNFYALDAATGKKKWVFMEADWVGSSPCISADLNLIFVGLEFGLWKKRGGIVALDLTTGEKKWEYILPAFTHSSPAYSKKYDVAVCGCNDFSAYGFDGRNGKLLWKFETGGEIKASFAFHEGRELVAFGSFDKFIYILKIKTGELVYKIETDDSIYSDPVIDGDRLYIASLDKNLSCVDLKTGLVVWKFHANGRIFASPEIVGNSLYIGSNDGRLYELDMITGKNTAYFQATERITNKIAYNKEAGAIFLPTTANEIYCLRRI